MPIHDWTRVTAGTFHDMHVVWLGNLRTALNGGILPPDYYALAEQVAQDVGGPDVLTLHAPAGGGRTRRRPVQDDGEGADGGLAVETAPPQLAVHDVAAAPRAVYPRRHVVVRHATGDRPVALLEIVSPGNKDRRASVDQFVAKATVALGEGLHLQVIDLFPPGPADPAGLHAAIWADLGGRFDPPAGRPLTLAAYAAGDPVNCYVEPSAVRMTLTDLPLFLTPVRYVNVPLEATYMAAYAGVPDRWKAVIEGVA